MHTVEAKWVLNHQFLGIHEWGAPDPETGKPQYEAVPMIGYDNMSERYAVHWIDAFGGRFSETLGYGKRVGNEIDFIFEYPDGPFRTNFIWAATRGQWHWLMTQKNTSGQWKARGQRATASTSATISISTCWCLPADASAPQMSSRNYSRTPDGSSPA
jgi:hypothetical protein